MLRDEKTLLLLIYLAGGVLLILLSLPLRWNKVKPNPLYGFRVPKTLDNPAIWYAANRFIAKRLMIAGLIFTIGSLVLYFIPGLSIDSYALSALAMFVIPISITLIQGFHYLHSL